MKIIIFCVYIALIILFLNYIIYQLVRNEIVYRIHMKWIDNEEYERLNRYDYDFMLNPNKKNLFGLKWPNEKDYTL